MSNYNSVNVTMACMMIHTVIQSSIFLKIITAVRVAGQDKAQPMWSWCFYQTNWKICITSYMWYVYIQIEVSTVHSLAMDAVPAGTKPHLFFRESSVVCSSSPLPFLEEPPGYAPSFHFRREMWVNAFLWG